MALNNLLGISIQLSSCVNKVITCSSVPAANWLLTWWPLPPPSKGTLYFTFEFQATPPPPAHSSLIALRHSTCQHVLRVVSVSLSVSIAFVASKHIMTVNMFIIHLCMKKAKLLKTLPH